MYEVAIIGAGPAGCATAIQLKRYGIDPIILEKSRVGGLLLNANLVENYPGFPKGIRGVELANLFQEHLTRSNIEVKNVEVIGLDSDEESFHIKTKEELLKSQIVVVASGTRPKGLTGLQIPDEARDRVIYEVYPILGLQHKRMAIVGSGDAAFDYALNLAKGSNDIVILNRSPRRKCLPSLWCKVAEEERIGYEENIEISHLSLSENGLLIECKRGPDSNLQMAIDYLIIAIGRRPQIDFISSGMKKSIRNLQHQQKLYFVGDVKRGIYRQAAIAVGDGIYTAMRIANILRKEKV